MNRDRRAFLALLCALLSSLGSAAANDGFVLLKNSPGLSQAIDINNKGHLVGRKDVEIPDVGFSEQTFFWDGENESAMPMMEGFTNVQAEALADNGFVVGYAARSAQHKDGGLEACIWDTNEARIFGLGRLEGHRGSQAFDVSDSGNTVVGYSAGPNPSTMVPVVWRFEDGDWNITRLSTLHEFNPYLMTSRVVVSPDGTKIAACITVEIIDRPLSKQYRSSTFVWFRQEDGSWQREKYSDHQLRMGDINDSAVLTGSALVERNRRPFVIDSERKFRLLEPLEGDTHAAGTDINNSGIVVGYSDDLLGPEGGPRAVFWNSDADQVKPLVIPDDPIISWAAAINRRGDIAGYLTPQQQDQQTDHDNAEILARGLETTVTFVLDTSSE